MNLVNLSFAPEATKKKIIDELLSELEFALRVSDKTSDKTTTLYTELKTQIEVDFNAKATEDVGPEIREEVVYADDEE